MAMETAIPEAGRIVRQVGLMAPDLVSRICVGLSQELFVYLATEGLLNVGLVWNNSR